MKDVECAVLNGKKPKKILQYLFFDLWGHFEYKNDHNSKNKNPKFGFSFYSADSGSFM